MASDSQTGFNSDYNMFTLGLNTNLANWGGAGVITLSDWRSLALQDFNSLEDVPLFVDMDGSDNIFGYTTEAGGFDGGTDDNFYLAIGSPGIDRADTWSAPLLDMAGSPYVDDPGTINEGADDYYEHDIDPNSIPPLGIAKNWRSDDTYWTLPLPFNFSFYGNEYSSLYVSSNGFLQFGSTSSANDGSNSFERLTTRIRIAPLWDDLRTDGLDDDIYVTESVDDVIIHWDATSVAGGNDVNVAVTLYQTGEIKFYYGSGNINLTPTIGISNGDGKNYLLSIYDGISVLADVNVVEFTLLPGHKDIGAYEYLGGIDITPPVVLSTEPNMINYEGVVVDRVDRITVEFSEPINPIDALALNNYELLSAGPNGTLGDSDDIIYYLDPNYIPGASVVDLKIQSGFLPADIYQLTIRGDSSIHDLAGNRLDGDEDSIEGGDYIRTFDVHHIFLSDVNRDYYVDEDDLAEVCMNWLREDCMATEDCNNTDLSFDGRVDFTDFAILADEWLYCSDPDNTDCDDY